MEAEMRFRVTTILLIIFCTVELFPQKVGDAYRLNINNIDLPLNRKGILAQVNIPPGGSGGKFNGNMFLFSGGFFLSGYSDGQLWANGVAPAALVEDYLQGTYQFGQNDPRAQLYKVRSDDPPFGQSWQDWADAVALGADFYDGNVDGVYIPFDLNGNNLWDPEEDHPDLLGDELLWCVYYDIVPAGQRRWNTVEPLGIEIRQSVFAYSSQGPVKNIIFIRYRIKYVGLGEPGEPESLDDVYFGVWDDPDLGDALDDLAGCDIIRAVGYTYNDGPDNTYGNNPPSFVAKTLAGPAVYIPGVTFVDNNGNGIYDEGIDVALDTANVHRGQILGIIKYPGAKNLKLSSSIHYLNGDPELRDPNNKEEARNYILGFTRSGYTIDPCIWPYSEVRGGVDCTTVDPKFWYSGDPVMDHGWINVHSIDQRQMQNIGPFTLTKGSEQEILLAYVVGQGTDALTSINEAKYISDFSHWFHEINFNEIILSIENKNFNNHPEEYLLSQNYPNPFNPSTTIKFTIPSVGTQHAMSVQLKVYDVLGKEVVTLVNEEKPAGTYEVEWNASNLLTGVYFYQLKTEDYVETKKMILMK
jgi:hypothetical protein